MSLRAEYTRGVPARYVAEITAYVEHRRKPGPFIAALLANDNDEAIAMAPPELTMDELRAIVMCAYNAVPGRARRSKGNVAAWVNGSTPSEEEEACRKVGTSS